MCPSLGYVEFLHIDWLKQIMAWQQPNGCYSEKQGSKSKQSYKRSIIKPYSRSDGNSENNIVIQRPVGLVFSNGGIHNKTQLDIINTKQDKPNLMRMKRLNQQYDKKLLVERDHILGDNPGQLDILEGVHDNHGKIERNEDVEVEDNSYPVDQDIEDKKAVHNLELHHVNISPMLQLEKRYERVNGGYKANTRRLLMEKEMDGKKFRGGVGKLVLVVCLQKTFLRDIIIYISTCSYGILTHNYVVCYSLY